MDQLHNDLQKNINGKKYVWNKDPKKWHNLRSSLMNGAKGSRVLVTSRPEKVAKITHPFQPYYLKGLEKDKSWQLFKKIAFGQEQALVKSDIMAFGLEILEKCKGVLLAIKTIGSILYFKNPNTEWLFIRDNDFVKIPQEEDDILPTLKLSCSHIPLYLKHCFAYCRLFPKNDEFDVQSLIKSWIAQGYVKSNQNQSQEDVGYGSFLDVLWRSFFQEAKRGSWCNTITSGKIHDLAISVSDKHSILISQNDEIVHEKLLFYEDKMHRVFLEHLQLQNSYDRDQICKNFLEMQVFAEFEFERIVID